MHVDLMRDPRKTMPTPDELSGVVSLRIWHCGYSSLAALAHLPELRVLVIATFPDAAFDMLTELRELRYLRVMHLPKVTDLSPLSGLRLETLSLETIPSWDSKGRVTEVMSLEPIGSIDSLRHLSLFGVVPKDRSLEALHRCRGLVSARFSKYPKKEIERFYAATGVSDAHVPDPFRQ
jgi:hypothetical protein